MSTPVAASAATAPSPPAGADVRKSQIHLDNESDPLNVILLTQNLGAADPADLPPHDGEPKDALSSALTGLVHRWVATVAAWISALERTPTSPFPSSSSSLQTPNDHPGVGNSSSGSRHHQHFRPVDVFVLHVQEIGGKKFNDKINALLAEALPRCHPTAAWCSGLLMCDRDDVSSFTAMGTVLFLSPRAARLGAVLNVRRQTYIPVTDLIEAVSVTSLLMDKKESAASAQKDAAPTPSGSGGVVVDAALSFPIQQGTIASHSHHQAHNATSSSPSSKTTPSLSYVGSDYFYGAKFSNAGTSRKGFVLTSVRIGARALNFMNMHLFHDADNTVAASATPSQYAGTRSDALMEALNETACLLHLSDPLFLFGDFNVRLDAAGLVGALKAEGHAIELKKKHVLAPNAVWDRMEDRAYWPFLQSLDREVAALQERTVRELRMALLERPVTFAPTFTLELPQPLETSAAPTAGAHDTDGAVGVGAEAEPHAHSPILASQLPHGRFRHERLPAWCDRVIFNDVAHGAIAAAPVTYASAPLYPLDHRSVYLGCTVPLC
jgi:inositol-1,4,5-trisphosphate 5-phosphatase